MISHLDLMIALIERFAKETARRLAAPMQVSQAPYMSASDMAHGSEELAAFESFIANNISGAIVVEDAARPQDVGTHAVTSGPRRHRAVEAAVHSKNSAE
jgi:DNA-directed RNA polymerase beta subunit